MQNIRVGEIFIKLVCAASLLVSASLSLAQSGENTGEGGQLFGDWVVRCETNPAKLVHCKMAQMAIVETTNEPLLRINIRYLPTTTESAIQFVLPLGISLKKNPVLTLDQKVATELELDLCLQDGCYSTFPLSPELLEQFLSMQAGALKLHAGNGEDAEIPISGKGSRAAFRAMRTMADQLAKRQSNSS